MQPNKCLKDMKNLTQPRYLVIADYPNSPFNVGNILTQHTQFNKDAYFVNGNLYTDRHPEDYPHIFRLLHWWEFRDEKDMPEYVKIVDKSEIVKIHSIVKDIGFNFFDGNNWRYKVFSTNTVPATLNEYNEYIKNK